MEKTFELGSFVVNCSIEDVSPIDNSTKCFISKKNDNHVIAFFDYDMVGGKVMKSEAQFHKDFLDMIGPAEDEASRNNFKKIKEYVKDNNRTWVTVTTEKPIEMMTQTFTAQMGKNIGRAIQEMMLKNNSRNDA
jgi:predicted RNA-binding protein